MPNSVKFVGWFSDLRHGRPDAPTLRRSLHTLTAEDASAVADYLSKGVVIAETTGAVLLDQADPATPEIGPFRTLTDGEFVWPSDLAHYVRSYGAAVPDELVQKARTGSPPDLSDDDLDRVADAIFG